MIDSISCRAVIIVTAVCAELTVGECFTICNYRRAVIEYELFELFVAAAVTHSCKIESGHFRHARISQLVILCLCEILVRNAWRTECVIRISGTLIVRTDPVHYRKSGATCVTANIKIMGRRTSRISCRITR